MARFLTLLLALLLRISAATQGVKDDDTQGPKVVAMGDSIMSKSTPGWAVFVADKLSIPVVNWAVGGASARSFTEWGNFSKAIATMRPGDFGIMAFGMNDGINEDPNNRRMPCAGEGNEVCHSRFGPYYTYSHYIIHAVEMILQKGGIAIMCGPIPRNPYQGKDGQMDWTHSRFATYLQDIEKEFNNREKVTFVDHGYEVANEYRRLGTNPVRGFYTRSANDNTHPNVKGMQYVTQAFITALRKTPSPLNKYVKD